MLNEFEKKVAEFIATIGYFSEVKRVLLAISGGADSTALLYTMHALKNAGVLRADFVCAHINHQLRVPDADIDEKFVVAQAESLGLAIITRKINVRQFAGENKQSIETAARILRIKHLQEIAEANGCGWIATAHQKNDNAETLIHRLLRGTGFRGLAGIWPVRNFAGNINFVRPLLCVGRDEIIEYLKTRNLRWRLDRTNYDCRYRRNFIRHRLIPELQRQSKTSIVNRVSELAKVSCSFHNLVCRCTDEIWLQLAECSKNKITLDLRIFAGRPQPVKIELICRSLNYLGCGEGDLTQQQFERILQLSQRNVSGLKIKLPDNCEISREYGELVFAKTRHKTFLSEQIEETVVLKIPGQTKFGDCLIDAAVLEASQEGFKKFKAGKTNLAEWFDFDKLRPPLVVRRRRSGDKFVPLGLAAEKKVGKFLTAAKVPQLLRKNLLVISDNEKIIWLCPVRISEQPKVTSQTSNILRLQIAGTV